MVIANVAFVLKVYCCGICCCHKVIWYAVIKVYCVVYAVNIKVYCVVYAVNIKVCCMVYAVNIKVYCMVYAVNIKVYCMVYSVTIKVYCVVYAAAATCPPCCDLRLLGVDGAFRDFKDGRMVLSPIKSKSTK